MTDKRFIEQFEENVQKYPDKVILRDEHSSLTFRELDELSGRVYAYLKEKGIGREDFVMIALPRGVEIVAAMIGVWKAGAAVVIEDPNAPLERRKFIYRDCHCVWNIHSGVWGSVLQTEFLCGYETTDVHDAAVVCYTSGSLGGPRGVLHEFGKLDICAKSLMVEGKYIFEDNDVYAVSLNLSAASMIALSIAALWAQTTIDIFPTNRLYDIEECTHYVHERGVTIIGLPPSYVGSIRFHELRLKYVLIGTEIAQGLELPNIPLINIYAQTESLMAVSTFRVDRAYDNIPIGKGTLYELQVENSDEYSELCVRCPYTRGYINLPEETAKAFRNGLYHTGDIARINEDGNYVILGRKSDMIKINGNRIEPAEIEAAIKKMLNIDWAFAKGFVEPERSFIVVYYTAPITIDYARTREKLMKILPTYMIPSYFVHLDEIPHLPNGKVDRQALKAPEIDQYRAEYVAPENELEERICQEMEKVLGKSEEGRGKSEAKIGILDDFYLLGGDSLRTIDLVTNLGIEELTVTDIYAARTPRAIAERWMRKMIE